jgi:putative nucleotidyltransferase with HDIG domain
VAYQNHSRTIPLWAKMLVTFVGLAIAAEAGNLLSLQHSFSTVWPPAGLLVAMLLISERRDWPGLIGAALAANFASDLFHDRQLVASLGFATSNSVEAILGALLVSGSVGMRPRLETLRQNLAFTLLGGVVAPLFGALMGMVVVVLLNPGSDPFTVWYTWFIGDALGVILIGSMVLSAVGRFDEWREGGGERSVRNRLRPLFVSLIIAIPFSVISYLVLSPLGGGTPWKFLTSPGMLACGLVGSPVGAALGFFLIATSGMVGMVRAVGASETMSAATAVQVFQAQAFFVVWGVCVMALSGVIAENRRHISEAQDAAERFKMLFDSMREGVAHSRIVRDSEGQPVDWVVMRANAAYSKVTGIPSPIGRRISELMPSLLASNPEMLETFAAVAESGTHRTVDSYVAQLDRVVSVSVTSPARGEFLSVIEDSTERIEAERALEKSNSQLEKMVYDVAAAMGSVVEARDLYTQGHQIRVATLARLIGAEMGLAADALDELAMAALLHDIGKLRVPAEILNKPGKLSVAEMMLVQEHPAQGYETLRHIDFRWRIADIVLQHHERLDGSGYPSGLRGERILLAARILAAADVIEAIASHRPYRPALSVEAGVAEIVAHPELYDADVAAACQRLLDSGAIDFSRG